MPKRTSGQDQEKAVDLSPQLRLTFAEEERVRREEAVEVRCRACNRSFALPRWYVEAGIRLTFCSKACRQAWEEEKVEEPFRLRLEGRPEYRGGNWEVQAARARARDGFRCQECGVTEEELKCQLDVHHLVPFRLFPTAAEANRLSNLISVCRPCHRRLEEEGRAELPLFSGAKPPGQSPQGAGGRE